MPTIAIIGLIVIGLSVCGDFQNRTIQMELSSGHSRATILISKIIAVAVAFFLVFLPYPLGRAILQGVFIQFSPSITIGMYIKMLAAFVTIILVGLAIDSIAIFLSFLLRKSVLVIGISFVVVVLGGMALMSFGMTNTGIGSFLEKTPLGLFKALAIANYEPMALLQAFAISLFCIGVVACVTYAVFRRAELK